jgi:hypothetical protein
LIYSYATHLRKGSYRSLRHSRSTGGSISTPNGIPYENSAIPDEDEDIEDFYRVPLRTPQSGGGASVSSFTDLVGAPGRGRKGMVGKSSLSRVSPANGKAEGEVIDEVLFDEDDGRKEVSTDENQEEERGRKSTSVRELESSF